MSDRITEAFDAEIADLKAQLDRAIKARADWVGTLPGPAASRSDATVTARQREIERNIAKIDSPQTYYSNKQILGEVQALLKGKTEPTSLSDIFQFLELLGICIGGKTPKNTLSAMLSTSGILESHGRSGWTLKEMPNVQPLQTDFSNTFSSDGEEFSVDTSR